MPSRMVIMKKTITSADKDVEKLLYCWWVKWYSLWGNRMVVPQKIKQNFHVIQQLHLRGTYLKELKAGLNRCLCTNIHSSIMHNSQKVETNWISINWWIGKQNVVYPYNTFTIPNGVLLSQKTNEVLISATAWRNLENLCQVKEVTHKKLPNVIIWNVQDRQIHRESRLAVARPGKRGEMGLTNSKLLWGVMAIIGN